MMHVSLSSRSPRLMALGGLIAMAVGIGIGRFVYTPILPPMLTGLGMSGTAAGVIASANFAGYLTGALGAAGGALPGGRRTWLLTALAASAATTAGMGLVGSVPAFLLLRFLGGVASALVLILASALVLDRLALIGRTGLAPLHFAGVGIGIACSAALVAGLSAMGCDWQTLWLASGGLSLIGTFAVAGLLRGQRDEAPGVVATGAPKRSGPVLDPRLRRMTLAYGLFGFGYVITATFLVAIVRATPAVQALEPVIWIVVGVAAGPSVLVWGALGRRFGLANAFAVAALAEAAGVLFSVLMPNRIGLCVAAVLVGGTFMGLTAMGLMRGRELARGDSRRVMALMTGAFGVGQIVGPLVAGALSDRLGGFLVPSVAAAGALVLAAWLARRSGSGMTQ